MAQLIPEEWKDKQDKVHNLQVKDLNPPASFVCRDLGLQITLANKHEWFNEGTKQMEPVEGTGCRIKFVNGYRVIANKMLMKLLMESEDYKNGKITPDPDDPGGFWRAQGVVKTVTRTIVEFDKKSQPSFEEITFGKKPEGKVQEIEKVV